MSRAVSFGETLLPAYSLRWKDITWQRRFQAALLLPGRSLRPDSHGGGTFVNYGAKVIAFDSIVIGRHCLIGPNVGIYDFDHGHELNGVPFSSQGMETAPVEIGDNVWIGANAVILKGARIGSDTVVGAGAVVSGDVPPHSLVFNRKEATVRIREMKTAI